MNSLSASYFRLQLKRSAKFLPTVFAFGAVLLLLLAALSYGLFSAREKEEEKALLKVEFGVVVNEEDPYQKLVLFTLQNVDESRFAIHITPLSGEEEAREKLLSGELSAALLVPPDFSEKIQKGVHVPIRYLSSPAASGISAALTGEVARSFSRLVLEGENSVYGLQDLVRRHAPEESPSAHSDDMLKDDLAALVDRALLFETEEVGLKGGLDFARTVRNALTVFFLLILGVALAPFFGRSALEVKKLLAARGTGALRQSAAEYGAYFLLYLFSAFLFLLPLSFGVRFLFPSSDPLLFPPGDGAGRLLLLCVFAVWIFSSFHFALSEWTEKTAFTLLAETILGIAMGFLSGCFYPATFLPVPLQKIGAFLPSGAVLSFFARPGLDSFVLPAFYFLLFAALSVLKRKKLLGGKAK